MKKALVFITLVISFTLLFAGVALAKNGPHQGPGMPQDTDACAGCHRAHTGTAAQLLKDGETVYAFCTTCHNGTGANTNTNGGVFSGTVTAWGTQDDGEDLKGLNGGGFLQAAVYNSRSGRTGFGDVTSRHNLEGLDGASPWTAWGGGTTGYDNSGSGPTSGTLTGGGQLTLKCTSCHDPHGSANPSDGSERYRILLNKIKRYDAATNAELVEVGDIKSNEGLTKDYTKDQYKTGMSQFCAACHTQYVINISQYNANDGKGYATRYRHSVPKNLSAGDLKNGNGLPVATNLNNNTPLPVEQSAYNATIGGSDVMSCLTCHQAHGTRATMTANSNVSPANSSTLLRLNNRGVCQDCHQK